jgi:hypothetical protein
MDTVPFISTPEQLKELTKVKNGNGQWLVDLCKALEGRTIKQFGYVIQNGEAWPTLLLDDGSQVAIERDDEGNGPGVLRVHGSDVGPHLGSWQLRV